MSKRKLVVTDENKDDAAWTIGYNARMENIARRLNPFGVNTTGHHQWNHGWDQAHAERIAVKVAASD